MKLAMSVVEIIGGLLLIPLAIFREHKKPTCLRIAMGISGLFAIGSGALGIAYWVCRAHSTYNVLYRLQLLDTVFGGIFVGMGLVLLISRNLRSTKKIMDSDNQERERSD